MKDLVVFKRNNGRWVVLYGETVADFMDVHHISVRQLVETIPGCLSRFESPVEECLAMSATVPLKPEDCEYLRWRDGGLKPFSMPQEVRAVWNLANLLEMTVRVEFSDILAITSEP